jgi:hypothetical protein
MQLNQFQKTTIDKFINSQLSGRKYPLCEENGTWVFREVVCIPAFERGPGPVAVPNVKSLLLECEKCGFQISIGAEKHQSLSKALFGS